MRGGADLRLIEGGGRGGDRGGGGRTTSSVEDERYYCWECENTERFFRYSTSVIRKEEIDVAGRVVKDLGVVTEPDPAPQVRCAVCDEVLDE